MPLRNDLQSEKKHYVRLDCPSGVSGVGYLSVWLSHGEQIDVEFKPHEIKIVLVLHRARQEDAGVAAVGAQGWRSRRHIAEEIEKQTGYLVGEAAISAYAVKLLRKLSAAIHAASPGEEIPLIERRRKLGFRLAKGVEIDVIEGREGGDGEHG